MLTFPIPAFVAAVLVFLFVRNFYRRELPPILATLLLICAVQNVNVALVQFYFVDGLRPVQAITASFIPVVAWIAFQYEAMESATWQRIAVHLTVPLVVAVCVALIPSVIDVLLVVVFVAYGVAIIRAVRSTSGSLPAATIGAGPIPARLWQSIAVVLIVMALIDATISLTIYSDNESLHQWILSAASSCLLLAVGLLGTAPELSGQHSRSSRTRANSIDEEVLKQDCEILSRLEEILHREQLYLDPDLSLMRLARKLGVPSKQLSASVNRHTKTNISRFVNRFRVEHACSLLDAEESITNAMFKSGFSTKSNFNREFRRVTGQTPREWTAVAQSMT